MAKGMWDPIAIGKMARECGYSEGNVRLLHYIHRRAEGSGQGAEYFRNGPREDQMEDISMLGRNLGMGEENDLHLVVQRVNLADPEMRDAVGTEEIARLSAEAKDHGVRDVDLFLSRLMLFFDTKSSVRKVLDAYESEILPTLRYIKSQNA